MAGKAFNPWATGKEQSASDTPDYPVASYHDFAAPSGDAPYTDTFGWAPTLSAAPSAQETPSAQRVQAIPRYDYRPWPQRAPEEWWDRKDADDKSRHSAELQDTNGWPELKGRKPQAPNPRLMPPPEPRPTTQMSPNNYSFTRPFDQLNRTHAGQPPSGSARHLNGRHFSMAAHRRTYEILGMKPPRYGRNTYRIEPTPWDENVVDMPPAYSNQPAVIRSVDVPPMARTFRLG